MLPLAELQRAFHRAILTGQPREIAVTGPLSFAEAISIHRNTAIGGLINALRLAHPTVDALVGEAYFDQVGRDYVVSRPPRQARLDDFGATFAAYLETVPSARSLPYLSDVARLDWAIDHALHHPCETKTFAIDSRVAIRLPVSLSLLKVSYPADVIRDSLGDDAALAAIKIEADTHYLAIWRHLEMAAVRALQAPAGRFLNALISGEAPDTALAQTEVDPAEAVSIIQTDIFSASFCAVISPTEDAT